MKLCHAPCPGQGCSGNFCLCFFSDFRTARYPCWVLNIEPNGVSLLSMRVSCLQSKVVTPRTTSDCQHALFAPVNSAKVCCIIWLSFQIMLPCHPPWSRNQRLSHFEPITTQTCRRASEGTHTENNFAYWGDENFAWANGPPTYAPKKRSEKRGENCAEKNWHHPAVSRQKKLAAIFGVFFKAVFHPIGFIVWPTRWSLCPHLARCLAQRICECLRANNEQVTSLVCGSPCGTPMWLANFAMACWKSHWCHG